MFSELFFTRLEKFFSYKLVGCSGVCIFSAGFAFVSSYNPADAFGKVSDVASFIAYLLTNSYLAIVFGIVLYLGYEYFSNQTIKKLNDEVKELKDESEINKTLRDKVNMAQETADTLRVDIIELQKKQAIIFMKFIFKLRAFNHNVRASIYYEIEDGFSLLARHAPNPYFSTRNTQRHSRTCGAIAEVWQHGELYDNSAPSFNVNPEEYSQYMVDKYGLEPEFVNGIKMKSRSFLGFPINDADVNIGVILFESTAEDTFEDKKVRDEVQSFCSAFQSHLCSFVRDFIKFDRDRIASVDPSVDANALESLGAIDNEQ